MSTSVLPILAGLGLIAGVVVSRRAGAGAGGTPDFSATYGALPAASSESGRSSGGGGGGKPADAPRTAPAPTSSSSMNEEPTRTIQRRLNTIRTILRGNLSPLASVGVPWLRLRDDGVFGRDTRGALQEFAARVAASGERIPDNLLDNSGRVRDPRTPADFAAITSWLDRLTPRLTGLFLTRVRSQGPGPVIVPVMQNVEALTAEMERQGFEYRPDRYR